jgi:hypothetical protein
VASESGIKPPFPADHRRPYEKNIRNMQHHEPAEVYRNRSVGAVARPLTAGESLPDCVSRFGIENGCKPRGGMK